jgi:hypothetical protein
MLNSCAEYVDLYMRHFLFGSHKQMAAFRTGFNKLCDMRTLSVGATAGKLLFGPHSVSW